MEKPIYTVAEVAEVFNFSEETIRRAIRSGELKAARAGTRGAYRISKVELQKWWREVRGGGDLFEDRRG